MDAPSEASRTAASAVMRSSPMTTFAGGGKPLSERQRMHDSAPDSVQRMVRKGVCMLTWCDADSATGNLTGSAAHYAIDLQPFSRPCNHRGKALSRCVVKNL